MGLLVLLLFIILLASFVLIIKGVIKIFSSKTQEEKSSAVKFIFVGFVLLILIGYLVLKAGSGIGMGGLN